MLRNVYLPLLVFGVSVSPAYAAPPGYQLSWSDEFDGNQLDMGKWTYLWPGKHDGAVRVPDAVSVQGGKMSISTYTKNGTHYTSFVASKLKQRYGYWEAAIDFHDASGVHSAFWLFSDSIGKIIGDPRNSGVEVDVIEHRAVNGYGKDIAGLSSMNLHWDGYGADHKHVGKDTPNAGLESGYHVYGLEWTPDSYSFFVDGKKLWQVAEPISQVPAYIILSSEVGAGGGWAGPVLPDYGPREKAVARMDVDYVRVYTK
jgi:beta-glucanase (GH16 family)